jgi:hypothetical protein
LRIPANNMVGAFPNQLGADFIKPKRSLRRLL